MGMIFHSQHLLTSPDNWVTLSQWIVMDVPHFAAGFRSSVLLWARAILGSGAGHGTHGTSHACRCALAAANGRVSECTDYGVEVQKVCTWIRNVGNMLKSYEYHIDICFDMFWHTLSDHVGSFRMAWRLHQTPISCLRDVMVSKTAWCCTRLGFNSLPVSPGISQDPLCRSKRKMLLEIARVSRSSVFYHDITRNRW